MTKNGEQLQLASIIQLQIPAALTDDNGGNPDMTLWNFQEEDTVWVQEPENPGALGGVFLNDGQIAVPNDGPAYLAYLNHFGWTNVDCFYNDPREKTTILVSAPNGYTDQNSSVYIHYDGNGSALALLDTFDSSTGLFSEHYGQIPIGLVCHIIFTTEDNGQWRYAIKPATITANAVYNFTLPETIVGSKEQMIAAIDALP